MPDPLTIGSIRGGVVEKFGDLDALTYTVGTGQAVTGSRLVESMAGDRIVRTAQAASRRVRGVALWNAAAGEKVSVARAGTFLLRASGNIVAGDRVAAAASGEVSSLAAASDPDLQVGTAEASITSGADGPIALDLT